MVFLPMQSHYTSPQLHVSTCAGHWKTAYTLLGVVFKLVPYIGLQCFILGHKTAPIKGCPKGRGIKEVFPVDRSLRNLLDHTPGRNCGKQRCTLPLGAGKLLVGFFGVICCKIGAWILQSSISCATFSPRKCVPWFQDILLCFQVGHSDTPCLLKENSQSLCEFLLRIYCSRP